MVTMEVEVRSMTVKDAGVHVTRNTQYARPSCVVRHAAAAAAREGISGQEGNAADRRLGLATFATC